MSDTVMVALISGFVTLVLGALGWVGLKVEKVHVLVNSQKTALLDALALALKQYDEDQILIARQEGTIAELRILATRMQFLHPNITTPDNPEKPS